MKLLLIASLTTLTLSLQALAFEVPNGQYLASALQKAGAKVASTGRPGRISKSLAVENLNCSYGRIARGVIYKCSFRDVKAERNIRSESLEPKSAPQELFNELERLGLKVRNAVGGTSLTAKSISCRFILEGVVRTICEIQE